MIGRSARGLVGAWLCIATLVALAEVAVPTLTSRVIDLTGTLTGGAVNHLETELADLEARKGSQIAVLIVPTTQPEDIEQFGIRVADQWKLGRKGVDDGAILIVAKDDRRVRIEVGYGLEGALPDATANRILDETIKPHFKVGDYDGGVEAGIAQMIAVVNGEPLPEPDLDVGNIVGMDCRTVCRSCCSWWSWPAAPCARYSAGYRDRSRRGLWPAASYGW